MSGSGVSGNAPRRAGRQPRPLRTEQMLRSCGDVPGSRLGLRIMWLLFATAACATTATPPAACSCPGQPELCKPLDTPLPSSDVHVYSDCTSPPAAADPDGCDWHKTLNFSAVTTIVQGSKLGGQLVVDNDGSVSWRTKSGPSSGSSSSSLICTAHSHGVRVLPIVDPPPAPHHVPGTPKKPRDYQILLQNSSAISRAASELATLATAAGFDGVEFDWEGMGAPYEGAHRSKFDYGTAYVSLLRQTRAAVRKAHQYGSTYVTIGLNNVSSKTEKPVFAAYPLKQMADATDGMFIMACEAVHVPSHASVSFCRLLYCSLAISSALTTYTKTTTRKINGACRMCVHRRHEPRPRLLRTAQQPARCRCFQSEWLASAGRSTFQTDTGYTLVRTRVPLRPEHSAPKAGVCNRRPHLHRRLQNQTFSDRWPRDNNTMGNRAAACQFFAQWLFQGLERASQLAIH
eukprot:COSAG05_NODE_1523_length_4641_cov_5.853589_4_plen_459_part_00